MDQIAKTERDSGEQMLTPKYEVGREERKAGRSELGPGEIDLVNSKRRGDGDQEGEQRPSIRQEQPREAENGQESAASEDDHPDAIRGKPLRIEDCPWLIRHGGWPGYRAGQNNTPDRE